MTSLIFRSFLFLVLMSQAVYSQDLSETEKKSFTQYLLFRKDVITTKSEAWFLVSDIRNLSRVEKWSSVKQKDEISEAEQISKSFLKPIKNFSFYEKEELEADISLHKEVKNKIAAKRLEIKQRLNLHHQIKEQITLCRKRNREAYNKTKQLLEIRKNIETLYLTKQGANFPQGGIDMVTKHLETADLLADISKMDFEVINLEKVEKAGFSVVNEEIYDPKQILENLVDIDERLKEIIVQSTKNIKSDSRTLVAVQAISAN